MDINSEKIIHLFNECVKEQLIILVTKICEQENLNWVEIAEKYDLLTPVRKEYKPKKKENLKFQIKYLDVKLFLLKENNVSVLKKIIVLFVEDININKVMELFIIKKLLI